MTDVDWDVLADHLGGALEGTPEGARVARLVATDPGWGRAAATLSVALDTVAADLRTLPPPTLPDDIAARLDAALHGAAVGGAAGATAPGGRQAGGPGAVAAGPGTAAAGGPGGSARPGAGAPPGRAGSRRPPSGPGNRPRRRPARWGAGVAVAAGVVAFAAIGFVALDPPQRSDPDAAGLRSTAQDDLEVAPPLGIDGPFVVATGTDYRAPLLPAREPHLPSATPQLGTNEAPGIEVLPPEGAPTGTLPRTVPVDLERLWLDPTERDRCLGMVGSAHGPPPVRIDTVDFARFDGEAALVIWLTTGDGERWIWVAGPQCGTSVAGPDARFQTRLS